MPTPSTHLGLSKPLTGDNFATAGLAANLDLIDNAPGLFICTSTTRPSTWGVNQAGRRIIELDTGLNWQWNGTAFVRQGGSGWIGGNRRTADLAVVDSVFSVAVQQTNINVPAGGRRVTVTVSWNKVDITTTGGAAEWALYQGVTQLVAFNATGGRTFQYCYAPGTGIYTFSAQLRGMGSAATLRADATHPCSIDVVEV